MQGNRVDPSTSHAEMLVGDYKVMQGGSLDRRQVAMRLPGGDYHVIMAQVGDNPPDSKTWGFTEHEDGAITLSPSINAFGQHPWHGFLERGEFREC